MRCDCAPSIPSAITRARSTEPDHCIDVVRQNPLTPDGYGVLSLRIGSTKGQTQAYEVAGGKTDEMTRPCVCRLDESLRVR